MALSMKHFPNYLRQYILRRYLHVSSRLCEKCVRVRFAPSPTGQLHLGSLRSALFNYLFAKSHNGKFILRIEDTDQTRIVPGAITDLHNILSWASLHPDEGPIAGGKYGPYVQSERLHLYKKYIQVLLENGTAYRCFCSQKRLELLRKEANKHGETPKYDGRCSHLTEEDIQAKLKEGFPYVVRLKLTKLSEPFEDLVYGPLDIDLTENEGDPILMKTDNYPTYHFANVIDDHLMEITHVLRGLEWQTSTPKHLMLYQAFGWSPPKYAHLPLILNKDGTKLSKRQNDIHVEHLMKEHYYPETLLNYVTVSGGGFSKADNEVLSLPELVEKFDLSQVKRQSGRLEPDHLTRINQMFIKKRITEGRINELIDQLTYAVHTQYSEINSENFQQVTLSVEYLEQIIMWSQDRITKIEDLAADRYEFLWLMPKQIDLSITNVTDAPHVLQSCIDFIQNIEQFEKEKINKEMQKLSRELGIKFNVYMTFLRMCFTGLQIGPSIGEIMTVLGRMKTIDRLKHAIQLCQDNKIHVSQEIFPFK